MGDEECAAWLAQLRPESDTRHAIVATLRDIIRAGPWGLREALRYGGLLFLHEAKPVVGVFIRSKHVTVELAGLAQIQDEDGFLEGRGVTEGRRHLRLTELSDIEARRAEVYIDIAAAIATGQAFRKQ